MKYRIRHRLAHTNPNKITRQLTSILYILPIIALTALLTSALLFSRHAATFSPVSGTSPGVNIVAPANNAGETHVFQLIAQLPGYSPEAYDMFWYVDNGQWNWMSTSTDNATKWADIDVSSWHWHTNDNAYTIVVVAVLHSNGQRVYGSELIRVGAESNVQQQTGTAAVGQPLTSATTLYTNPNSSAAQTATASTDPTMKRVMTKLARVPTAVWLGDWNHNVKDDVAATVDRASAAGQTPVFVAYNLPGRDCGSYSAGGEASPEAYKAWITAVANGIGSHQAIVILEPDALAQITCLNAPEQATRNQLLSFAVAVLKANAGTRVYLDAGNPSWIPAETMAERLKAADIAAADGFSLNVSNFIRTSDNITYGSRLSKLTSDKHFVIDTSRNGNGSSGEWCNPAGRALGAAPTARTGNSLVDYLLWIKTPGESDGTCNGGPAAGVWWPSYAESLALSAGW